MRLFRPRLDQDQNKSLAKQKFDPKNERPSQLMLRRKILVRTRTGRMRYTIDYNTNLN